MTPTWRVDFKAYSFVVVEMADFSVTQRCADVSRFSRVLVEDAAIWSLPQFAGLVLARWEGHSRSVVSDHRLARKYLTGNT